MIQSRPLWLPVAAAVCFLAIGIPHWLVAYDKANVLGTPMMLGLVVVGISALLVCAEGSARFWQVVCYIGLSVPAAVICRIAVDVANKPTSHNLWPIEVILSAIAGLVCALLGAIVGALIARFFPD